MKWRQPKETGELPRGPVKTIDGYLMPIAFGGVDWNEAAYFLDDPELNDAKFATPEGRLDHAEGGRMQDPFHMETVYKPLQV